LPLWKAGLDYRHGTGHGVGAALNVHEGPQGISFRPIAQPLMVDMIVSNEPGYYEDNKFGIRIENLAVIEEAPTPYRFAGKTYMTMTPLTYVPIETKLIDVELLSDEEVAWVNEYHEQVLARVAPRLRDGGHKRALAWLEKKTERI
jgi:Xaa-Pro aminopeptidase